MVFTYKDVNYCFACDWLQYSVRLQNANEVQLQCPAGFRLELLQGNNIFRNRAILWRSDGLKYLTLLWSPYSRKIKADIMTAQVANPLLYMDAIHESYRLLQSIVPCYFNSMGRIDVCCDYELDDYRAKLIRGLYSGEYYVQGKREGSDWWHTTNDKVGSFPHCLSWGSASSEIKVKTYNKSRELGVSATECGEKPYISARWRDAGFDVERVWRLEFSMKSAGQLRYLGKPITLNDVADSSWLISCFLGLYSRRFVVRYDSGGRLNHHNDDKIVALLNLPSSESQLRWGSGSGDSEVYIPNSRITALRKVVAMLDSDVCRPSRDVFEIMANSLYSLLDERGMRSYFSHAYGCDVDEWISERWEHCGEGIDEVIAEPNCDI